MANVLGVPSPGMDMGDLELGLATIRELGGIGEIGEVVKTYRGYRQRPDGSLVGVTVEIEYYDTAPSTDRWVVKVTDQDGRQAGTNGGSSIEAAAATVHWDNLDDPARGPGQ